MTSVLVAGAGGLLGKRVVSDLRQNHQVIALHRQLPGVADPDSIALDLSRPLDVSRLPGRVDAIIYLAQSSRFREFPAQAADIFSVNVARLQEMLDYARIAQVRHFVHASSGSVYGSRSGPLHEDMPVPAGNLDFYGASKLSGELLARCYSTIYPVVSLRYFFIYGAGQKPEMLIPRLVDRVRNGQPILLDGEEGLKLNPVHVSDAARATAAALLLNEANVINVAGPEPLTLRSLCQAIAHKVGREPVLERSDRPPLDMTADVTKMETLLTKPLMGIEEGLDDLS